VKLYTVPRNLDEMKTKRKKTPTPALSEIKNEAPLDFKTTQIT
jgi:hypothetical protein